MSKHVRVNFDDPDPEPDPLLNGNGLAVVSARQVRRKVVDEVRLPLKPGVDRPDNAKEDAQYADAIASPRRRHLAVRIPQCQFIHYLSNPAASPVHLMADRQIARCATSFSNALM